MTRWRRLAKTRRATAIWTSAVTSPASLTWLTRAPGQVRSFNNIALSYDTRCSLWYNEILTTDSLDARFFFLFWCWSLSWVCCCGRHSKTDKENRHCQPHTLFETFVKWQRSFNAIYLLHVFLSCANVNIHIIISNTRIYTTRAGFYYGSLYIFQLEVR